MKPISKILALPLLLFLTACETLKIHNPEADAHFSKIQPGAKQYDIALVLGGGGVRGIAHLGVIEEFEASGIRPDLIVGCSAGAIVGALYADYPSSKSLKTKLFRASKNDFLPNEYWVDSRFGVTDGKAFHTYLTRNIHSKNFSELRIPLVVVATDLSDGKLMELHQGDIPKAVLASAAFPGVFEPVLIHGKYLIDGGVVDNIPIQTAKKFNPKIIIAVDIGEALTKKEPTNLIGIMKRALEISYHHNAKQATHGADIVIKMNFEDMGLFDESKKEEIYQTGRLKARAVLADLRALIREKLPRRLI